MLFYWDFYCSECSSSLENYVIEIIYRTTLTHWGRATHICISKLAIIGSDNVLSPGRRQAIIWTDDGILLIGPLGTNFIEILIAIYKFSFKKMHLKMSSGKWRPSCLGLDVLKRTPRETLQLICPWLYNSNTGLLLCIKISNRRR